jgi:DNA-binding LytR/AlgR family response regulator
LKVIFVSGYAEDAFRKNLPDGEEFNFLAKPFSLRQLVELVKQVMATAKRLHLQCVNLRQQVLARPRGEAVDRGGMRLQTRTKRVHIAFNARVEIHPSPVP